MRLEELFENKISESVNFNVSRYTTYKDDNGTKKKAAEPVGSMNKNADCSICHGTGKNTYQQGTPEERTERCIMCKGTGKIEKFEYEGPTLNVSNDNANDLIRSLGLEFDYSGQILPEQLPELRKKLLMLLNSDKAIDNLTKDDEVVDREMGTIGTDGNVTFIDKKGPAVYNFGRSITQVKRYYSVLLDMVDYAMKNNYFIIWY